MVIQTLRAFTNSLLDLIYPPVCASCGKEVSVHSSTICEACLHSLKKLEPPFCNRCGMPIQGPIRVITENRCNACPPEPVYFDIARSIYSYHDDRVKNTIIALKYHYQTELAVPLAQLMLHGYHTYYRDIHFDGIIPIPLHRKRFKEREFNQAALIVDLLSKKLEIPILNDVVIRQKQTMPQASLAVKKRMRNLKGAFENIHPEQTQGKKFLVVDDVFTTGATTNEVCAALRYGKTSYLAVLTLARAVDL